MKNMDIKEKLYEYKGHIVLAGLVLGLLKLFDFLPKTLGPADETWARYVYTAIILIGVYCYWTFHWNEYGPKPLKYQKTADARRLGKPSRLIPEPTGRGRAPPSSDVFQTFKKD
jgi:uncharacterized membrane protein YuzA (DUF378 family)